MLFVHIGVVHKYPQSPITLLSRMFYSLQSYLRLAELPYVGRVAPNADYMSPSGMPSCNLKVSQGSDQFIFWRVWSTASLVPRPHGLGTRLGQLPIESIVQVAKSLYVYVDVLVL